MSRRCTLLCALVLGLVKTVPHASAEPGSDWRPRSIAQGRPDQALPHLDAFDRLKPGDLHSATLHADARRAASPPAK